MDAALKTALSAAISNATGEAFEINRQIAVGGGCINEATLISSDRQRYFVKLNDTNAHEMFTAEAEALEAINQTGSIKAPRPFAHGYAENHAFLILEAISFGTGSTQNWQLMGQQLAELHRHTAQQFGWHRNNTIGSTPQLNAWADDWATFFREQRLRPQFALARKNGFHFKQAEALLQQVEVILNGHKPDPSLLHGDLWSGNAGFTTDGIPVVFDPASYYGDREADLAFSEFFGGFAPAFYEGYGASWPLPPGCASRKILYNLYHVLNHANLFGGSYANQAQRMIQQLLA
jgi:fructosamine-3-kinase